MSLQVWSLVGVKLSGIFWGGLTGFCYLRVLVVGVAFGLAVLACRCWPQHGAVRVLMNPRAQRSSYKAANPLNRCRMGLDMRIGRQFGISPASGSGSNLITDNSSNYVCCCHEGIRSTGQRLSRISCSLTIWMWAGPDAPVGGSH